MSAARHHLAGPKAVWLALALAGASLAMTSRAEAASPGLALYADACGSAGGTLEVNFSCDTNTGPPIALIASVVPFANLPHLVGATVVVDGIVGGHELPPWWQTASGQCRAGAVGVTFDPVELSSSGCLDAWGGSLTSSTLTLTQGVVGPNSFRLTAACLLASGADVPLPADGTEFAVARLAVTRSRSTGANACAGCTSLACFLIEEIKLQQVAGFGDYSVTSRSGNTEVYVLGHSSALGPTNVPEPCWLVPTQNRTWGQLKGLYR